MKKLFLAILLTGFYFVEFADACDASLTDLNKPILITSTQNELTIRLKSNRTTGFRWILKNYDRTLLTFKNETYLAPTNKKLIGAPGIEAFSFQVNPKIHDAAQTGKIILVYARPWEPMPKKETVITWIASDQS